MAQLLDLCTVQFSNELLAISMCSMILMFFCAFDNTRQLSHKLCHIIVQGSIKCRCTRTPVTVWCMLNTPSVYETLLIHNMFTFVSYFVTIGITVSFYSLHGRSSVEHPAGISWICLVYFRIVFKYLKWQWLTAEKFHWKYSYLFDKSKGFWDSFVKNCRL